MTQPEDDTGRVYNQARRVYDRLRKRSYRAQGYGSFVWDKYEHAAYVQGVRDALNEVLR